MVQTTNGRCSPFPPHRPEKNRMDKGSWKAKFFGTFFVGFKVWPPLVEGLGFLVGKEDGGNALGREYWPVVPEEMAFCYGALIKEVQAP